MKSQPKPTITGRRFRFMMLNDMHLRQPGFDAGNYPRADERVGWAVKCACGDGGFEGADFVIGAGDIIDGHQADFVNEYSHLRTCVMDRLNVPFLPALGNHETHQSHNRDGYHAYDKAFGAGMRQYTFSYGGIGFIIVDACYDDEPPNEASIRCNTFLQQSLGRFAKLHLPVIIVSHVPFVPVRDEAVYAKSFDFGIYYKVLDSETLAVVQQHKGCVIAVLSGHIHLTGMVQREGIHHIVVSGTAAYPSDIATFDVYNDRMDVQMHRAPNNLLDRGANIHGRPRHGIDYIDSLHRDHESYLWGNPDERSFSILLNGEKQPAETTEMVIKILPVESIWEAENTGDFTI